MEMASHLMNLRLDYPRKRCENCFSAVGNVGIFKHNWSFDGDSNGVSIVCSLLEGFMK